MTELRLHPGAGAELEQAAIGYERERPGWGPLFFGEVRRKIAQAATLPGSGAPIAETPPDRDVRAYGLSRFPFRVIVALVGDERFVIAVAHTKREPRYWLERLG